MEGPIDNVYALVGFITVQVIGLIGMYMKVRSERKATSEKRDKDTSDLKEDMAMVKSEVANVKYEQEHQRDFTEKLMDLLSDIRADVAFLRGSANNREGK